MVVMGHITAPFGVKGAVKIQTDTESPDSLLAWREVHLGRNGQWRTVKVLHMDARPDGQVVAQFEGCTDRDAAFAMRGQLVAVPRSSLPEPDDDEYYWADLIGMTVSGIDDVDLGRVDNLLSTGANDVLVVRATDGSERLVPFVEAFVVKVDTAARHITTLWGLDY